MVGSTSRRCDAVQRSISPHPFRTPRFFAPAVVAALARCTSIALRAASRRMRKIDRCRDPHEFFNSLLAPTLPGVVNSGRLGRRNRHLDLLFGLGLAGFELRLRHLA